VRATFMPRPPPPAGRLDDDRIADLGGDARLPLVGDAAVRARHDRDAEPLGGALGLDLVAHDADVLAFGPMKVMLCALRMSAKRAFSDRKP
jgi:hypothetical protein